MSIAMRRNKEDRCTDIMRLRESLRPKYPDWLSIEHALRADGFDEARQLLDRPYIRDELNRICMAAKKRVE
jgi:hypothetical protein